MAGPGSGDLKGALEACACLTATRLYMDWEPRLGPLFSVQIAALRRGGAVYRGRSLCGRGLRCGCFLQTAGWPPEGCCCCRAHASCTF